MKIVYQNIRGIFPWMMEPCEKIFFGIQETASLSSNIDDLQINKITESEMK